MLRTEQFSPGQTLGSTDVDLLGEGLVLPNDLFPDDDTAGGDEYPAYISQHCLTDILGEFFNV